MTVGGAAGVLTVAQVPPGDATGTTNTQQYAFQYGVNANPSNTGVFTAHTRIDAPFAGIAPQGNQSMGFYIGTGDQDNYAKLVLTANGGNPGVQFVEEVGGSCHGRSGVAGDLARSRLRRPVSHRRSRAGDGDGPIPRHDEWRRQPDRQPGLGPDPHLPGFVGDGLLAGPRARRHRDVGGRPDFPATWSVLEATTGPPGP